MRILFRTENPRIQHISFCRWLLKRWRCQEDRGWSLPCSAYNLWGGLNIFLLALTMGRLLHMMTSISKNMDRFIGEDRERLPCCTFKCKLETEVIDDPFKQATLVLQASLTFDLRRSQIRRKRDNICVYVRGKQKQNADERQSHSCRTLCSWSGSRRSVPIHYFKKRLCD